MASLQDMPLEISHLIAGHCEVRDLAKLRLVSMKTLIKFSQPFGIRSFRKVRHHLTESSLKDLVSITEHEFFATCVDCIEFSTARTGTRSIWKVTAIHREDNPLNLEDVDFRRKGTHIEMLIKALNNIKARGNHNVRLGVFDTYAYFEIPSGWTVDRWDSSLIRGHRYHETFGLENPAPKNADPYGTVFAIAKAAARSNYELRRISVCAPYNSPTLSIVTHTDTAGIIYNRDLSRPRAGLDLEIIACETDHNRTYVTTTVTDQSLTIKSEKWSQVESIPALASAVNTALDGQERLLCDMKTYKKVTLANHIFDDAKSKWLLKGILTSYGLECLELINVTVLLRDWIKLVGGFARFPFTNSFIKISKPPTLKVSKLVLAVGFGADIKTLELYKEGHVARGDSQIQDVLDDISTQIRGWDIWEEGNGMLIFKDD